MKKLKKKIMRRIDIHDADTGGFHGISGSLWSEGSTGSS